MFPAQAYSSCVDLSTFATFRALVDAIVPRSPELAVYAPEQVYGAVDLCIHQYLIWELDHSLALVTQRGFSVVPLSAPAAIMLNESAIQVVRSGSAAYPPNPQIWPLSPYAALAPLDRIRVLSLSGGVDVSARRAAASFRRFLLEKGDGRFFDPPYVIWLLFRMVRLRQYEADDTC